MYNKSRPLFVTPDEENRMILCFLTHLFANTCTVHVNFHLNELLNIYCRCVLALAQSLGWYFKPRSSWGVRASAGTSNHGLAASLLRSSISLLRSSSSPLRGSLYCPWNFAVRGNWVSSTASERYYKNWKCTITCMQHRTSCHNIAIILSLHPYLIHLIKLVKLKAFNCDTTFYVTYINVFDINTRLTRGPSRFPLSPQNQKESDLSHLGNLLYIIRGHFYEKQIGGTSLPGAGVRRQSQWVPGWLPPSHCKISILKKYLLVWSWNVPILCMLEMLFPSFISKQPGEIPIFGKNSDLKKNFAYVFWKSAIFDVRPCFMTSLWCHTLDVCTYFGMYGKTRLIAIILWYKLDVCDELIFQNYKGSGNHSPPPPLGKPCYRKRLGKTRVNKVLLMIDVRWQINFVQNYSLFIFLLSTAIQLFLINRLVSGRMPVLKTRNEYYLYHYEYIYHKYSVFKEIKNAL